MSVAPGPTTRLAKQTLPSPLGPLLVAACDDAVRLVEYADCDRSRRQLERAERLLGATAVEADSPVLDRLRAELDAYFEADTTDFAVLVAPVGTPFQTRVWEQLLTIPAGQTRSYAAIAAALGDRQATRAVGAANGANPISILVPCHRVVRTGGALGGYGGGLDRKRWLLEHERRLSGATLFA